MSLTFLICILVTLLIASPVSSQHAILDTDIGDDFDDMMALTLISSMSAELTLEAVIVSSFNTTKRAMMVAYAFDCFYGATMKPSQYPPIVMGIAGPNTSPMYQFGYVPSNFTMEDYIKRGGRVITLKDVITIIENWNVDSDDYLRYIEIAPVSSLGYIIQAIDKKYLSNMRVFTMNGAIYKGYNGKAPPVVEYNVNVNIGASALMYENAQNFYIKDGGSGVVTAPLDTTVFQQYGGDLWQSLLKFNSTQFPFTYTLINAYQHWYDAGGKRNGALLPFSPSTGSSTMYDVQAAYSAVWTVPHAKQGCDMVDKNIVYECVYVRVNATGFVVIDTDHGQPIASATAFEQINPYDSVNQIGAKVFTYITGVSVNQHVSLEHQASE